MLSEFEIMQEIQEVMSNNPQAISLNDKQIQKIKDIYYSLTGEKSTQKKTKQDQLDMISAITIEVNAHQRDDVIYNRFADNRHMNYFDEFLGDGERAKIQKALQEYQLPTELLRPIRKNVDYDNTTMYNGKKVTVHQKTDIDDDGYRYVSEFEIYVDDELIYSFGNTQNPITTKNAERFLDKAQEAFDDAGGEIGTGETVIKRNIKTPTYTYTEEAYGKSNGEIGIRRRYAKGTIINGINVSGRFMKK